MTQLTTDAFDLPGRLAAKADPALISGDERHFAAIAESLATSIADLSDRLAAERRAPGGSGQEALERDLEVHRLTGRPRTLRRFGLDLCLGHLVTADGVTVYIGRLGLTDSAGGRLLLGWRSPRPSRSSARPTPTRWGSPAAAAIAGPSAGSPTTGTRCSPRTACAGTPRRSTTSPPSSPASAATGRPGCGTCSAPSRPTRTPSSGPDPGARWSSTAARAPGRRSSRCTAPPTCSTPTRGCGTTRAGCCSSVRAGRTWPTSRTCCPAWARRACRPARCGTWCSKEPTPPPRPIRRWPG